MEMRANKKGKEGNAPPVWNRVREAAKKRYFFSGPATKRGGGELGLDKFLWPLSSKVGDGGVRP